MNVPVRSPRSVAIVGVPLAWTIRSPAAKPTVVVPISRSAIACPVVLIASVSGPLTASPSTAAGSAASAVPAAANVPSPRIRTPAASELPVMPISIARLGPAPVATTENAPSRSRKEATASVPEPASA